VNLFRNSLAAVALIAVAVLLLVPSAEASRGLPAAIEPALGAPTTPDQVLESELSDPPERLRLFDDLRLPPRPLELVEAQKTASGVKRYDLGLNIRQTGGLSRESGGLSFQGLWTDPVTGISYARNRWYDARTASWLSEDPKGAIDSPNLYAFVGWGPHMGRDPMGLTKYGNVNAEVGPGDWFDSQYVETGWDPFDKYVTCGLNDLRNTGAGLLNMCGNALWAMGKGEEWVRDQIVEYTPLTHGDVEFLEIYFATNPKNLANAANGLRAGGTQALTKLRAIAKEKGWGDDLGEAWRRLTTSTDGWGRETGAVRVDSLLPGLRQADDVPGSNGVTLSLEAGWDVASFRRKALTLQDLASRGKLRKASGTKALRTGAGGQYKNRLIRRAFELYGKSDLAKAESLKARILGMHADHLQDLQLSGLDDASNLWLLDADVNVGLGRQIWQQIKNLPDGTIIDKIVIEGL